MLRKVALAFLLAGSLRRVAWLGNSTRGVIQIHQAREPSIVTIAAYAKKCYQDESGGSWIGLLNDNAKSNDDEPTITVNGDRLKAQFERPKKKPGLSTKKRKYIFRKLVEAEDRAMAKAESEASKSDEIGKLYNKYLLSYKKKIVKKYKLTEEQAAEIAREGHLKNWPMPPTELPTRSTPTSV